MTFGCPELECCNSLDIFLVEFVVHVGVVIIIVIFLVIRMSGVCELL